MYNYNFYVIAIIVPNPPQIRKKSEQQYYVQSDQHNKFQLVGSTTSDGVYDDTVTDPASDED